MYPREFRIVLNIDGTDRPGAWALMTQTYADGIADAVLTIEYRTYAPKPYPGAIWIETREAVPEGWRTVEGGAKSDDDWLADANVKAIQA